MYETNKSLEDMLAEMQALGAVLLTGHPIDDEGTIRWETHIVIKKDKLPRSTQATLKNNYIEFTVEHEDMMTSVRQVYSAAHFATTRGTGGVIGD